MSDYDLTMAVILIGAVIVLTGPTIAVAVLRARRPETWVEDHHQLSYLIGGPDMRTTDHWVEGRKWVRYWTRVR